MPIPAGGTGGANAATETFGPENSSPTSEMLVTSQSEPKPASLGALSLGSSGLAIWRRQ